MRNFDDPGICWKSIATGHVKSRRFLKFRGGNWQPKAGY